MRNSKTRVARVIMAAVACGCCAVVGFDVRRAQAGKFNRLLSVGDTAPAWTGLIDTDGKRWSEHDYADAKVVVIVFLCNGCPVAKSHESVLVRLAESSRDKGVRFLAINAKVTDADRLDAMKRRAKEAGFPFPYALDDQRTVGKEFGVTATPQAFVLDADRNIRYMGAIDDHRDAQQASRHYLKSAIDAVLEHRPARPAETRAVGCAVEYPEDS